MNGYVEAAYSVTIISLVAYSSRLLLRRRTLGRSPVASLSGEMMHNPGETGPDRS